MKTSDELVVLREKWNALGFLLKNESETKYYDFTRFGRFFFIGVGKSNSGYWDDFNCTGNVYTNALTLRKCRHIEDDGSVKCFNQLMIGKWAISWVVEKV